MKKQRKKTQINHSNYALSSLIRASIYFDLFFLVFRISTASCEIRTLIANVRPVAGRPVANLVPAFMLFSVKIIRFTNWGSECWLSVLAGCYRVSIEYQILSGFCRCQNIFRAHVVSVYQFVPFELLGYPLFRLFKSAACMYTSACINSVIVIYLLHSFRLP